MSNNRADKQIVENRKKCKVEARVVNSSFDQLFRKERNKNERRKNSSCLNCLGILPRNIFFFLAQVLDVVHKLEARSSPTEFWPQRAASA